MCRRERGDDLGRGDRAEAALAHGLGEGGGGRGLAGVVELVDEGDGVRVDQADEVGVDLLRALPRRRERAHLVRIRARARVRVRARARVRARLSLTFTSAPA